MNNHSSIKESTHDHLEPDSQDSVPVKKGKKKKSLIFILSILSLLVILILVINGPGARWFIEKKLAQVIEKQSLQGNSTVKGSISSGFIIFDAKYSGTAGVELLEIREASISYNIKGLLDKKITNLSLHSAKVIVDLAKLPKSKKNKEEQSKKDISEVRAALEKIQPWVTQPEIDITKLDVCLLKNGAPYASFQLDSLQHQPGTDLFLLSSFAAQDSNSRKTEPQDIAIRWMKNSAHIDQWELLPSIAIDSFQVDWSADLTGQSNLTIGEAKLHTSISEEATLTLQKGNISSQFIQNTFDLNLPASFQIEELNLSITNWKKNIPLWEIQADIAAQHLEYEQYSLQDTKLQITQEKSNYELILNSSVNTANISTSINGSWSKPTETSWQDNTQAEYSISCNALNQLPDTWLKKIAEQHPEVHYSDTSISLQGAAHVLNGKLHTADLHGRVKGTSINEVSIPTLEIESSYNEKDINVEVFIPTNAPEEEPKLKVIAAYTIEEKLYDASISISETNLEWINTILKMTKKDISLHEKLSLSWSGKGKADDPDIHSGSLNIFDLTVQTEDKPRLKISSVAQYDLPDSFNIYQLNLSESEWNGSAIITWNGETLSIPAIIFKNGEEAFAALSASTPLTRQTATKDTFFAQDTPWSVTLKSQPLSLQKLKQWFNIKLPDGLTGKTESYIELSGSPALPQASGYSHFIKVEGVNPAQNGAIDAQFQFQSEDSALNLKSNIHEGNIERLAIKGLFPFTPNKWIAQPGLFEESIKNSPIEGNADIHAFPLTRLSKYSNQLEKIEGQISGKGHFSGTFNKPIYDFNILAEIPIIRLSKTTNSSDYGVIRNILLKSHITEKKLIKSSLEARINGGKFEINSLIDINDLKNPSFDVSLDTKHALVHRNDFLSARTNSSLRLLGTIDDATISGNIGVTESLFYKDIELIPIGIPSSEVAEVKLPSISSGKDSKLPIPSPFSDWKLDVILHTDDPILIRGNVAKGHIEGRIKIKGTLAEPRPDGIIYIKDMEAKLPFSILTVDQGEIIFKPEKGITKPTLNIQGKSKQGEYDLNLLIHGDPTSPKTSLSSSPPLPETEIMALVATGSTTSGLASGEAAAFKAFQVFLLKASQRESDTNNSRFFKTLINGLDKLNLQIGQENAYTGRKFNSANIDISPTWYFTTQVDEQNQTRGLVVYHIRFR